MVPGFSVQAHKGDPVPNEQWLAFKQQAHGPWMPLVLTRTLSETANLLLLHEYWNPVSAGEF